MLTKHTFDKNVQWWRIICDRDQVILNVKNVISGLLTLKTCVQILLNEHSLKDLPEKELLSLGLEVGLQS